MKNLICVDVNEKQLIASKAFCKKAKVFGSTEYELLREAVLQNPGFKVVEAENSKKSYKKLTFEKMEEYIKTQRESEERMKEFEAVKKVSEAKNALYPLTKKWFFETYPEYKETVTKDETKAAMESAKAETGSNVVDLELKAAV